MRNRLYFCKSPTEPPHGVIELAHCLTVKSAGEKTGKAHAFEVATPEEVFYMYADSDEEKDDWIGKIGKAIVDNSRSHIREAAAGGDDSDEDEED